jgi:hypothetical protein
MITATLLLDTETERNVTSSSKEGLVVLLLRWCFVAKIVLLFGVTKLKVG